MTDRDGYRDIYLMIEKNQIKNKIDSAAISRYRDISLHLIAFDTTEFIGLDVK